MKKIIGEKMEDAKLGRDLKDTVILAVASIALFMIAAFIETYMTPSLLGM